MSAIGGLLVGAGILTALSLGAAWPVAAQSLPSETRRMSFEACLHTIRASAGQFGVAPINIVETNELRIVRFNTRDGSVLVTCSRPDNKMVVTKSPHQGR